MGTSIVNVQAAILKRITAQCSRPDSSTDAASNILALSQAWDLLGRPDAVLKSNAHETTMSDLSTNAAE